MSYMKSKQRSFFIFLVLCTYGIFVSGVQAEKLSNNTEKPSVIFETSMGSFTVELNPEKAPITVSNFLRYVDDGFYNNTIFHRVIPDFVIQGGGFEKGMKSKKTRSQIKNESSNRLKNITGTIAMARRTHPDTATSQFYINLKHNDKLDYKGEIQPGYTVFGKVSVGTTVINKIAEIPTVKVDRHKNVPKEDVVLISVKRKGSTVSAKAGAGAAVAVPKQEGFVEGEHYIVLDKPVATRDSNKIEVVEMFSYGCPHCYEFEPLVKDWAKQQGSDVDFWVFPAVWNNPMKLYAGAFYTANELKVADEIHKPLFTALVVEQKSMRNEGDLADFFVVHGVDRKAFAETFNSMAVESQVKQAEERVRQYKPVGTPEVVVNGKYRVDRMNAGGLKEMLDVVGFLVEKERALLKK